MAQRLVVNWHSYRYFPYERKLALCEVSELLSPQTIKETPEGLELEGKLDPHRARRLTYFSKITTARNSHQTDQSLLENWNSSGGSIYLNRQNTRYSVHGLHEYKGKFNPQIVRCLLNIFRASPRSRVLDPFCGSGTTLVECSHCGIPADGIDFNPLAVYIANAKLHALASPAQELKKSWQRIRRNLSSARSFSRTLGGHSEDRIYLSKWIDKSILKQLDILRQAILQHAAEHAPVFLVLVSDLIREYSLQEPADLRIRRRKSPMPSRPLLDVLDKAQEQLISKISAAQKVLGLVGTRSRAFVADVRDFPILRKQLGDTKGSYKFVITSPPYATALPYIDTQRLSLVWLGLVKPQELKGMEVDLIGSREFSSKQSQKLFRDELELNAERLPKAVWRFCRELQEMVSETDGFRRQAVPALLYRYFAKMRDAFRSIATVCSNGGRFALIVGHNHTTLGGNQIDIDTPNLLRQVSMECGWIPEDVVPLDAYQRYELHRLNSITQEDLVLLRKNDRV